MEWKFVDYKLGKFDFGNKWRPWMLERISPTSFSILLNEPPCAKASRGMRQGDPLCPFLLALVVEALGALLKKAKEMGL